LAVAVALQSPKQVSVVEEEVIVNETWGETLKVTEAVQPFASEATTVCVPVHKPVSAVVLPIEPPSNV
jgi:hypothetical protein